jgi:hypothetical protein
VLGELPTDPLEVLQLADHERGVLAGQLSQQRPAVGVQWGNQVLVGQVDEEPAQRRIGAVEVLDHRRPRAPQLSRAVAQPDRQVELLPPRHASALTDPQQSGADRGR